MSAVMCTIVLEEDREDNEEERMEVSIIREDKHESSLSPATIQIIV